MEVSREGYLEDAAERNSNVYDYYTPLGTAKCIETYKDDEKMKHGKIINNQLIQAIKDSRFFIIVFSKNYASLSWCLGELVEIMECQKTHQQTSYLVFCDVEPTEVHKQSGAFRKAFFEIRTKDAAGKWIEVLKGASNLVGKEL
nr:Toll/interleukin-1 receptor (TIR) domain-containing protein [Tanacetum cinerariifolium]